MAVSLRELDDDSSLVLAVQQGDTDAFGELFRRHYQSVRRVCARRLGNIGEADEVAQGAFVRAYERIDQCGGERRFGAWVQVIASRMCIDVLRARARTTPEEEPVKGDLAVGPNAPEEALLSHERSDHVHLALASLPARQREVVIARHLEDRRPGEIAAALGMSIGAVDSLLLRARKRLATSYQSVATDSGITNLSTAAAATLAGSGVAAGPTRLGRVLDGVAGAINQAAYAAASAMGMVPGVPGAGDKIGAAILAGALVVAPMAPAPRRDPGPALPTAPQWVPGAPKPELVPEQLPAGPGTSGDLSGRDLVPREARDVQDPSAGVLPSPGGVVPAAPTPEASKPLTPVAEVVEGTLSLVTGQ